MKKRVKKLELAKETVRSLEEADLSPVAGGGTPSIDVICKRPPTWDC